jgi:hypothetical protein
MSCFELSIILVMIVGKSFENYATCGSITGRRLEIKTSGRYTSVFHHFTMLHLLLHFTQY